MFNVSVIPHGSIFHHYSQMHLQDPSDQRWWLLHRMYRCCALLTASEACLAAIQLYSRGSGNDSLFGRAGAEGSSDTTDHCHKWVSDSSLTGNLNAWNDYCISHFYFSVPSSWQHGQELEKNKKECNLNCNCLYYDNIYYCEKREVVCHARLFHLIPICCITGKLLWAALACLNLPGSGEPLISATRLIQIRFWRKGFFIWGGGWASATAVVVGKWEEAQEGQFNLECLSLVYQLLRFKRPGQLELSDFCHFDLFLFFCCNVYFNSRPPAVCV